MSTETNAGPAFQFYASDWLTGTTFLSLQQQGIYIRLLSLQWEHRRLPKCLDRLVVAVGGTPEIANDLQAVIAAKFTADDDGLFNARLEGVRNAQLAHRKERSESGKRGAKARWTTDPRNGSANGSAIAQPSFSQWQNHGSSSSSSSSNKKKVKRVSVTDHQFDLFWTEVPRKVKKRPTRDKLQAIVDDLIRSKEQPTVEAAVEFLTAQARHWRQLHEQAGTEPRFIEHPTTWLNGRRWEDYAEGSNSRSDAPPAEFEQIVGQYLDRSLRDEFGASAPLLWKRDEAEFRAAHPELWKWAKRHRPELLTAIEPQSARSARLAELREVA